MLSTERGRNEGKRGELRPADFVVVLGQNMLCPTQKFCQIFAITASQRGASFAADVGCLWAADALAAAPTTAWTRVCLPSWQGPREDLRGRVLGVVELKIERGKGDATDMERD